MRDEFFVVQVSPNVRTGSGDYVYRIGQPAEAMGKPPGIMVANLPLISPSLKEMCLCADVLVLHLVWEPDLLPVVAERKRRGLATVFEISDNFLALPPSITHELSFSNPINLSTTFQLIRLSDAIQGVSEILIERFSFLHDRRAVFENQIMEIGSPPKAPQEDVVIGWGGSMGHTEDLEWIAPVIQEICRENSCVRFAFMGNKRQYTQVFGKVVNSRYSYRNPGKLSEYFDFLEELDIGLAPLKDIPFNICRSDVKFIEYASRGVVPVLSDAGPYKKHARHGVNAFLFESPESLKAILDMLIRDRSLMQRIKENAYNYVRNERMEKDHCIERISFYKGLAGSRSPRPIPMHLLESSSAESTAYRAKQSSAETRIIQGLDLRKKGRLKEAREMWSMAAVESPGYYFPLLLVADSLMQEDKTEALEYLRLSSAMNPESLRARLLLGQALKRKDAGAARKEFESALRIFPDFAPAWKELALMEKECGRLEDAAGLMDRALKCNPFYPSAASELGRIYLEQGKRDLAVEAFRVAADLIPDNPDHEIDLVKALILAGKTDEAARECGDYLERYPGDRKIGDIFSKILGFQGK